jgi:hydroxymethylpyrimidine/phosphomethylpyrimidine kinase
MQKIVLCIGSYDQSGCSGLIADIKTLMAYRFYAVTIITAITSQNTQRVEGMYPVPLEMIGQQFDTIIEDFEISAVKIGLMPYPKAIELVATLLKGFGLSNIVLDPVMASSTGFTFLKEDAIQALKENLIPLADVLTPNLSEAAILSGIQITDTNSMKDAAAKIAELGCKNVIIKGGHFEQRAIDCLYDGSKFNFFDAPKLATNKSRGTGDTFATIIAVHLAKKQDLYTAIDNAKKFIARAMSHQFKIGNGPEGPLNYHVPI